ncbi:hypothetical protein G6F50_016875 [Rhizopus delemar]|uniref:D-isomer specific 2-hydroxyacid dehydrogenase NAD-binding domain-containing protein n=1 Tax=Rhizopus delemar TaxID=936053 RepID=A0A9P7C1D7_9FUNG|nr:hypothetical protein G6F50_016875 [Rhizopus delemar]
MGLVIACMRNFRKLDQLCRDGVWRTAITPPPNVSGKRLGIFGMGAIGEKLATRASSFRMPIGYHNRNPKAGSPYHGIAGAGRRGLSGQRGPRRASGG